MVMMIEYAFSSAALRPPRTLHDIICDKVHDYRACFRTEDTLRQTLFLSCLLAVIGGFMGETWFERMLLMGSAILVMLSDMLSSMTLQQRESGASWRFKDKRKAQFSFSMGAQSSALPCIFKSTPRPVRATRIFFTPSLILVVAGFIWLLIGVPKLL